jgi:hypothetical protein
VRTPHTVTVPFRSHRHSLHLATRGATALRRLLNPPPTKAKVFPYGLADWVRPYFTDHDDRNSHDRLSDVESDPPRP